VVFTINAIAISWLCWLPLVAAEHGIGPVRPTVAPLLIVLGTFGPFFAAVAMVSRRSGFRGLRAFIGQAFRWRVGIQWYAAALLAPALIRIVVLYVHVLKGGTVPDLTDATRWLAVPSTFFLVLLIGGPTGEEFGWRGYLLQRVQSVTGVLWASVIIGVISTLWHLPLFWIPATAQSHLPFALFAVRTVALSIISTWLYNGTRRSLLFVLLFHASLNTWPNTIYILEAEGAIGPYLSTTIVYAGWAIQLVILGLLWGRGDRRKPADATPAVAA
jgi:membrane protease YdiL (CAAX protease family)